MATKEERQIKIDSVKKNLRSVKSKYGSKKTKYKSRTYDSKFEAEYARKLDLLLSRKELSLVVPQYKIPLVVNGELISNYYMDFKVILPDGTIEMHEVKGMETQSWKIKFKLAKALYPEWKFIVIKK